MRIFLVVIIIVSWAFGEYISLFLRSFLVRSMIMIVSLAIENNLVYFDCFVIVSWAIEI